MKRVTTAACQPAERMLENGEKGSVLLLLYDADKQA
jgi:hypothetical protein